MPLRAPPIARVLQRLPLWLAACSLAGCLAAGGWLERSVVSELPLDQPAHSYPTAVYGPLPPRTAGSTTVSSVEGAAPTASLHTSTRAISATSSTGAQPSPSADPSTGPRIERTAPPVTPLAILPPAYAPPAAHPPKGDPSSAAQPAARDSAQEAVSAPGATPPVSPALSSGVPPTERAVLTSSASQGSSPHLATEVAAAAMHRPITPPNAPPPAANDRANESPSPATADSRAPLPAPRAAESDPPGTGTDPSAAASPADRQAQLDQAWRALIESLEEDIRQRRSASPQDEELPRREQQLRLAYLAAGRWEEAVAGIDSLPAGQREAFKHLMFGLGVWLSPDESRRAALRGAKVLRSLREATRELAASSKLEIKNLAFCERVDYYGWYTEFPRYEFQPRQQVILYVEIENFAAEHKPPAGYETELHGSYEILDAAGQIVASRQLPPDREVCRNYRRDYFLAYRIYLPEQIAPGRYRLELTIEDLKARSAYQGRKLGEGTIEFTIR